MEDIPLWRKILERNQSMSARSDEDNRDEDESAEEIEVEGFDEFGTEEKIFDEKTERGISEYLSVEEHGFIPLKNGEKIELNLKPNWIPEYSTDAQIRFIAELIAEGKYTKAKKITAQIKRRKFYLDFYRSLGLRERGGLPLRLCADDIIRLEMYNRKAKANRLLGKESGEPMKAVPLDIYAYIWRNSVILARNNLHVFMMPIHWVARGMSLDKSSISTGFRTIEDIGLIRRIGKVERDNKRKVVAYEIVDLDTFFRDNELKIPRNYRIRDRVPGNIVIGDEKRRRSLGKALSERDKEKMNNPLWGVFGDIVE